MAKPSANVLANLPDEWQMTAPKEVTGDKNVAQAQVPMTAIVAKAQSMLGSLGYNAGPADGQMGPRTRTAIRNFQKLQAYL